jgi:transcriptional regulator with XRE-family HTH domain
MDPVRLGHSFGALRLNRRWRQQDVAAKARVSASEISRIELGRLDGVSVGKLRRVAESLDATLDARLRWNGEGLDRLLDQAHAGLVEQLVVRLRAAGWLADVEVSFSIRGERGSIDVLRFHDEDRHRPRDRGQVGRSGFTGDAFRHRPQGPARV